jgi:hypothetical protein
MKRLTRFILGATTALVAGAAVAGEATVFTNRDFRGQALTIRGGDRDIVDNGIRDVDSIIVHSGRWEFCARPDFGGKCELLGPGRYSSLREDWRHPIESAREVVAIGGSRTGAIEVYGRPGFRGRTLAFNGDVRNLGRTGLDDRVSSVVVNEGRWELCSDRAFTGHCRVFGPGEYPRLGGRLDDNVASLRRVG